MLFMIFERLGYPYIVPGKVPGTDTGIHTGAGQVWWACRYESACPFFLLMDFGFF